jgi:hypothetical protein
MVARHVEAASSHQPAGGCNPGVEDAERDVELLS